MNPSPEIADHPGRILIVDDDRDNREVLEIILTREGFLISAAASGEEALAMVAQRPPDLILLDIMMPDMTGYRVAAELKGNLVTKDIPIIMISALSGYSAKRLALSAGAEDLLTKPVDRTELCARVRILLPLKT